MFPLPLLPCTPNGLSIHKIAYLIIRLGLPGGGPGGLLVPLLVDVLVEDVPVVLGVLALDDQLLHGLGELFVLLGWFFVLEILEEAGLLDIRVEGVRCGSIFVLELIEHTEILIHEI